MVFELDRELEMFKSLYGANKKSIHQAGVNAKI